jgi:hypothetical protein
MLTAKPFKRNEKGELLLSIKQLAEVSGRTRETVTRRLRGLDPRAGKKGALLYESSEALPLIFAVDSLEAARAAQALSQASLNRVREVELRKRLIPIQDVRDINDQIRYAMQAILQGAQGKTLTHELINHLFARFRAVLVKLKTPWPGKNKSLCNR